MTDARKTVYRSSLRSALFLAGAAALLALSALVRPPDVAQACSGTNLAPTRTPTPRPTPDPRCEPKDCEKCQKSPCYVASGSYRASATDLQIRTAGFPLTVARSYDSTMAFDGPMGFGWSSSLIVRLYYATYLFSAPSTYQKEATVIMPSGARYRYVQNANGSFSAPLGRYDTLVRNADGTFDLTLQRSRSTYHFDGTGALSTMTDDFGNKLTYTYDGTGRLQRVADSSGSGRFLDVVFGPNGRISTVQDSSGRVLQYSYTSGGALQTVTDPLLRVTTYGYVGGRFAPLMSHLRG